MKAKNFTQLQWACRRGMLELDILLGNFLNDKFRSLSEQDQQLFIQLLECPDPDLFAWLIGQEKPADESLIKIIEMIRLYARSKSRI